MLVLKRDLDEAEFDVNKIEQAILKAMKYGSGIVKPQIAKDIANEIYEENKNKEELSIYDIEEMVFNKLIQKRQKLTARAYEGYRSIREFQREAENTIDEDIDSLIEDQNEYWKDENANKNPILNTTKRDYMAGIVSTDAVRRILLPPDIIQAHDDGIIHFHDADYFLQHSHNCFNSSVEFITDKGVRKFADCIDGEQVQVIDKNGFWQTATVRKYGKQPMNRIVLKSTKSTKTIIATANHRWVLKNGEITTNLQVGQDLYALPERAKYLKPNVNGMTRDDCEAFTIGFIIGDGTDHDGITQARICGDKKEYIDIFKEAGWRISYPPAYHGDAEIRKKGEIKQRFLNSKAWDFMKGSQLMFLFLGLYAADGNTKYNRIASSDERIVDMIKHISCLAGYYISSVKEVVRNTNYKKNAKLTYIYFRTHQNDNNCWKVMSIEKYHGNLEQDAWCVEEPATHTFTLNGGIVTGNCDLVNLDDMLQNGTVISEVLIEKPKSFQTACTVTTQIIAQVSSSQYGGQSISLCHLAPFVDISRQKIREQVKEEFEIVGSEPSSAIIDEITEKRLHEEIKAGIQTIQYQLTTIMTTNGQAPFITIFMYLNEAKNEREKKDLAILIEEVLKQRIQGVKAEDGTYIAPAFPKLIYVTEKDNITEDSPYWYLTKLAAECTTRRLVPDYISEKMMLELKGDVYTCMGCRSFLTPDDFTDKGIGNIANAKNYVEGQHKYYGRFNQGVVTLNLPDIALSSEGDIETFWNLFEERTELCHRALRLRHERLLGTLSDVAPILWQHGALARLGKHETIDRLLYDGYSTISLGYAGLYECVKYMTGKSHSDEAEGEAFGLQVMQALNDKCKQWKEAENIAYSLYGTPLESTTYKFAKKLQERFGVIEGITDRNYITNSYHIPVFEKINAFEKLRIEAKFQKLSPGGAISYIEVPNMTNNVDAVLEVIKYMYENIMYAEINTKACYCEKCGYEGDIPLVKDEGGKLIWECPNCLNRDSSTMDIAFRVCGYIGTAKNGGNQGRYGDVHDRVMHLGVPEYLAE